MAKRYAIDVVKRGQEVLVIFPEGEIYYLNDLVQPFKSGVVEIGMQAVVEARREQPDWTAYLVPMAIKYRYRQPIRPILERKTRLMEQRLFRRTPSDSLPRRLALIVAELLHRQEMIHHLAPDPDRRAELTERVQEARRAVLSQIEAEYAGRDRQFTGPDDGSHLAAQLLLAELAETGAATQRRKRAGFRVDLAALEHVAQMGSWQPSTWIWTRRRNASRKWSSSWSGRSTGSSGHANWPIATSSSRSANRSTSGDSSRLISRIRKPSATPSLNNSADPGLGGDGDRVLGCATTDQIHIQTP